MNVRSKCVVILHALLKGYAFIGAKLTTLHSVVNHQHFCISLSTRDIEKRFNIITN
jgi:hypothetical protein